MQRYQVILDGWPEDISFSNLSKSSNTLTNLDRLLQHLQDRKIYWRKITHEELQELNKEREESGEIVAPAPCRPRSDRGKKRS